MAEQQYDEAANIIVKIAKATIDQCPSEELEALSNDAFDVKRNYIMHAFRKLDADTSGKIHFANLVGQVRDLNLEYSRD